MRILRQMTIAMITIGALMASTPAFAQSTTDTESAPVRLAMPTAAPLKISKMATFIPQTENEQGLGIFVQAGFLRGSTYNEDGLPGFEEINPNGFVFGVGFGGNKSGVFGIGVDVNYMIKSADNIDLTNLDDEIFNLTGELKTHVINIPIYARFNFFGHSTKSAPTLYAMGGGFIDILLNAKLADVDVKDYFNGFDIGPVVGVGFEVARVGVEARGQWAMKTLQNTGNGTFLNGLEESKVFTFVLLFKVRLN